MEDLCKDNPEEDTETSLSWLELGGNKSFSLCYKLWTWRLKEVGFHQAAIINKENATKLHYGSGS